MSGPGERLGVLGGTFDPPHMGHLSAAVGARHQLGLDRVLMVVANRPWQKEGSRAITPVEHRLAMTGLLIDGVTGLTLSTIEVDKGGASYTVDTLRQLAAASPAGELFLVVGTDAVAGLDTWHEAAVLPTLCSLAVVGRPGSDASGDLGDWPRLEVVIPGLEISSENLRARVQRGEPIDGLTTPAVVSYVRDHRLYGGRS